MTVVSERPTVRAPALPLLVALGLGVLVGSLSTPRARADEPGRAPEPFDTALSSTWFIPGGQASLVGQMLGGDEAIAGCRFENAGVNRESIDVTFGCGSSAPGFAIAMRHRPDGACPSACTEKFRIDVVRGSAPDGFVSALRDRVARLESGFRWYRPRVRVPPSRWRLALRHPLPILGGLGVLALVVFRVVKRKQPAPAETPGA